jgi:hypothetical protein
MARLILWPRRFEEAQEPGSNARAHYERLARSCGGLTLVELDPAKERERLRDFTTPEGMTGREIVLPASEGRMR